MRIKRDTRLEIQNNINELENGVNNEVALEEVEGLKRDTTAARDFALVFTEPDAIDMDNAVVKYEDMSYELDNEDKIFVVYPSSDTLDNVQLPKSTSKKWRGRSIKRETFKKSSTRKGTNSLQEMHSSDQVNFPMKIDSFKENNALKKISGSKRTNESKKVAASKKMKASKNPKTMEETSLRRVNHNNKNHNNNNNNNNNSNNSNNVDVDLTHYNCTYCSYTTTQASSLNGHMRAHTDVMKVAGAVQKEYTGHPLKLKCPGHTIDKSKSQQCNAATHPCPECDKTFKTHTCLRTHLRCNHTNPDRYSCELCDYKTSFRPRIVKHIQTHTGAKPYCCDTCNKSFACNESLKFHKQSHSDVPKPHVCSICNAGFSRPRGLLRHTRSIHEGIKPFKCGYCEKVFSGKDHLNRHVALHTGDKPHVCGKCGKGYIQPGNLKYHVQRCDGDGSLPSMVQDDTPLEGERGLEMESVDAMH